MNIPVAARYAKPEKARPTLHGRARRNLADVRADTRASQMQGPRP
jgi:hypothetical protein